MGEKRSGIGGRLRQIRKAEGLSQVELADTLGCDQTFVSQIERGRSAPSAGVVAGVQRLGYSPDWLMTGAGPMSIKSTPSITSTPSASDLSEASAVRDAPSTSSALEPFNHASICFLPILGRVPAGKPGVSPVYEEREGTFPLPAGVVDDPNAFCLRVSGDSMAGVVEEGDLVVVSPGRRGSVKDNDLVVVRIEPEATLVKRVMRADDSLLLLSSNPAYPAILVKDETVTLIGKVIYHIHHYK